MPINPGSNSANFNNCVKTASGNGYIVAGGPSVGDSYYYLALLGVGTNGGPSAYGTHDQGGNVWEWMGEGTANSGIGVIRGGDAFSFVSTLSKNARSTIGTTAATFYWGNSGNEDTSAIGFRVVALSGNANSYPNFVDVADSGNTLDANGYGSVNYFYQIGYYPVTNCEYVSFLNAVAKTDTYALYDNNYMDISNIAIGNNENVLTLIDRNGTPGNYTYTIRDPILNNKPVTYINWFRAARYCNWLHNGKVSGSQDNSTTEDGAYTLSGATTGSAIARNSGARYAIPTENEWYKAAYYKGGGLNAGYWTFPTQSTTGPTCINSISSGGNGPVLSAYGCYNFANYGNRVIWNGVANITTVGSNGISSFYETYDQGGNVLEWLDLNGGSGNLRRGGSFSLDFTNLNKTNRIYSPSNPTSSAEGVGQGFRIVSYDNFLNLPNFVTVAHTGNIADTNGYGSVNYSYQIAAYEVTNCEYASFLNAVASTDTYSLYNNLANNDIRGGIARSGSPGSYVYSLKTNMADKPVNCIGWWDAARYCNWLHNGKPNGSQSSGTTETGAYPLNGLTAGVSPAKSIGAKYGIPTENEWYKAAYYSPDKDGTGSPGYYEYPTQNDSIPGFAIADSSGNATVQNTSYSCSLGPVLTPTPTNTVTPTISVTPTMTVTPTISVTPTMTVTPTISVTPTMTVTPTNTPTNTVTPTISVTPTMTVTPTISVTPTITVTPTISVTPTKSITPTITVTPTITRSSGRFVIPLTPTPTKTLTFSPKKINKQLQLFKFLGAIDINNISLLSNTIINNIDSIYSIDNTGSWVSWNNSSLNSLTSLSRYKTYLIINKTSSPDYTFYSNTDILDLNYFTIINNNVALETYRGSTPIIINNASWKNNVNKIIGISSDGSSYLSWDSALPNNLNSLTSLQPNTGYIFFNKTIPFTLWSETLNSSNNWTYRYNNFLVLKFIPISSSTDIAITIPIIDMSTLPSLGSPAPMPMSASLNRAGSKVGDLLFINAYSNKTINIDLSGTQYQAIINNGQINF